MTPSITIPRVLLIETGTYNDPQYRPFVSEYDGVAQANFKNRVADINRVTPTLLAGVAGQIIQPATETYGSIAVPNGWDNRRFAFMIEVISTNAAGFTSRDYITGWTDIVGATFSGAIAPDMRLFVNNIMSVTDQNHGYGLGGHGGISTVVTDTSHVIVPPNTMFSAYGQMGNPQRIDMLTPHDIMTAMVANSYATAFDNVYNLSTGVTTSQIRKSKRSNCLPSQYVAQTLNAISTASLSDDEAMGSLPISKTAGDVYAGAADITAESVVNTNPFFMFLQSRTSFSQFYSLQWSELRQIQPYLDNDNITAIIFKKDQILRSVAQRGDSENWTSNAMEAIIAHKLAYMIPSIMSALMVTEFNCQATSLTESGMPAVTSIGRYDTFVKGFDQTPLIQRLIDRIVVEVFPDITQGGQIPLSFVVDVSLFEDIQMTINIAGRYPVPFRLPLFADAHYCPMVTTNGKVINEIATSLEQMHALIGYNTRQGQQHHVNVPPQMNVQSYSTFATQQQNWSNPHDTTNFPQRPSFSL